MIPLTRLKSVSTNAVVSVFSAYSCDLLNDTERFINDFFLKAVISKKADILHREIINLYVLDYLLTLYDEYKSFKKFFMSITSFFGCPLFKKDKTIFFPHNINNIKCKPVGNINLYPCVICPAVTFQKSLGNEVREISVSLKNNETYNINSFLKRLKILYDSLIFLSLNTGFSHNDLHGENILYDHINDCFVVIDFGRAYFSSEIIDRIGNNNVKSIYDELKKTSMYKNIDFNLKYKEEIYTNNEFVKFLPLLDGNIALDPIFADLGDEIIRNYRNTMQNYYNEVNKRKRMNDHILVSNLLYTYQK